MSSPKWTRLRGIGLHSFTMTAKWYRSSPSVSFFGLSSSMPSTTEASFQHTCAQWAVPYPPSTDLRPTADPCDRAGLWSLYNDHVVGEERATLFVISAVDIP